MGHKLAYVAEYVDANRMRHVAVHFYDRTTGIVDMMRDVKFEDMDYPSADLELLRHQQKHDAWKKAHPAFAVKPGECNGTGCFNVLDMSADNVVAVFFNEDEACQYADVLCQNEEYLHDVEDLEDDPML